METFEAVNARVYLSTTVFSALKMEEPMHYKQGDGKPANIKRPVTDVEMGLDELPPLGRPYIANKLDGWVKTGSPVEKEPDTCDVVFKHRNLERSLHLVDAKLSALGAGQIHQKGGREVLDQVSQRSESRWGILTIGDGLVSNSLISRALCSRTSSVRRSSSKALQLDSN